MWGAPCGWVGTDTTRRSFERGRGILDQEEEDSPGQDAGRRSGGAEKADSGQQTGLAPWLMEGWRGPWTLCAAGVGGSLKPSARGSLGSGPEALPLFGC